MTAGSEAAEILREDEGAEWDAFVRSHPSGTIGHTRAWASVLGVAFPHVRAQYVAVRDPGNRRIIGGVPVYLVRSALLGNKLVSAPFWTFCDPLVDCAASMRRIVATVQGLMVQERVRRYELRALRFGGEGLDGGFTKSTGFKHTYLKLAPPFEELQRSFCKHAVMQKLSKARKQGVVGRWGEGLADVEIFVRLLDASRRRLGLLPYPLAYFRAIWERLPAENRGVLIAERGGEPLGAALVLKLGRTFSLEFTGEVDGGRNTGANQVVYWEAIRRAKQEGFAEFSMGRTAANNTGLLAYKRRWGGVEEDLITYTYPADAGPGQIRREESLAYRGIRWFSRVGPMFAVRLAGRFFFKNWS